VCSRLAAEHTDREPGSLFCEPAELRVSLWLPVMILSAGSLVSAERGCEVGETLQRRLD
jgi:hypothetical protein